MSTAALRVCGSCEWIFTRTATTKGCPLCGFGHYGARFVYGKKAYAYKDTQQPWKEKKLQTYEAKLDAAIREVAKLRSSN